jgi:uncharacterized membrane protein YdbT with pleckstrin-like domain
MASKKIVIILTVIAVVLLVFTIIWDILSTFDIIAVNFDITRYTLIIATGCACFGAILATQESTKKKNNKK